MIFRFTLRSKIGALYMMKENKCNHFCTDVNDSSLGSAVDVAFTTFQPKESTASQVPIIILHGLLGSKQNWRGLAKAMAVKSNRKVYALDARNHGDSPHTKDFNYPLMSDDVSQFMATQKITEAVIIGHSMGGRTAMHLALTKGDLVNKLVIVDVSPRKMPQQSKTIPGYMRAMKEGIASISTSSLVQARMAMDDYLSKTVPESGIRQFLLTNLTENKKQIMWKPNIDVLLEKFESRIMEFPPVSGHFLKETLFICGGDSPFVPSEDHPYIHTLFPKAEFIAIPGAGHWVHSEKPSDFLEALYGFL